MTPERDWSKELAKIDKQLESISDEALFPTKPGKPGSPKEAAAKAQALEQQRTTTTLGVFARLALSVAAGVGIVFWPYEARCGLGLAAYLAAVAVVAGGGFWSAVWTWKSHALPTRVAAGTPDSTMRRRLASCSAAEFLRLVLPKAVMRALRFSDFTRWKNSMSLLLLPGLPPSI